MMATTHAMIALLVAAPLAVLFPDHAAGIAIGAILGGIFPDFDVLVGTHRKTLHFPVLGWLPVLVVGATYVVTGHPWVLAGLAFALGAVVHATTEPLGGGVERKPWEQTTTRAVYVHVTGAWVAPRHVIPYDGSPADLALAALLAPIAVVYSGVEFLWPLIGGGLTIALGYTLVRKSLPTVEDWLYENVPVVRPLLQGLHGEE